MKSRDCNDLLELIKFKKISIFLDKNFIIIVTILSGIFTILCLYNYFKELN